ncbi:hypothetical protein WJX82_008584 [Trebouxia sp. C0006]
MQISFIEVNSPTRRSSEPLIVKTCWLWGFPRVRLERSLQKLEAKVLPSSANPSPQRSLEDATEDAASQLCPVFPEPSFVTSLHPASIQCMIEAELQTKIPVPEAYFTTFYDSLYPGLFRSSSVDSAILLVQSVSQGMLWTTATRSRANS